MRGEGNRCRVGLLRVDARLPRDQRNAVGFQHAQIAARGERILLQADQQIGGHALQSAGEADGLKHVEAGAVIVLAGLVDQPGHVDGAEAGDLHGDVGPCGETRARLQPGADVGRDLGGGAPGRRNLPGHRHGQGPAGADDELFSGLREHRPLIGLPHAGAEVGDANLQPVAAAERIGLVVRARDARERHDNHESGKYNSAQLHGASRLCC